MHEIVYIQAGNVANYLGTHFWNTQEAYFDTGTNDESYVDSDISFREGIGDDGNFGPLPIINGLYTAPLDEHNVSYETSVGMVEEIKQTPIEKSEYQQALDNDVLNETAAGDRALRPPSTVRYWSDYNRVYYSPRTMQAVRPNTPDRDVTWSRGLELFKGFERETRLIEDSLRHFVEECDLLQGFQATFDNTSFGAFTMGLLEHIKDEYSKSPILTFPLLSSAIPSAKSDYSNTREAISIIGDSLVFRDLITSYASLVVPVQQPMNWDEDILKPFLKFNLSNIYQTSAILSAHFETSTLMLREKDHKRNINDLCGLLNWRGDTPIAHLTGHLPVVPEMALTSAHNFSMKSAIEESSNFLRSGSSSHSSFAQLSCIRSTAQKTTNKLLQHIDSRQGGGPPTLSPSPLITSFPEYPLPSSYPSILKQAPSVKNTTSVLSSLVVTSQIYSQISSYAYYVSAFLKRGDAGNPAWEDIGKDGLKDLAEELVRIAESYSSDDQSNEDRDEDEDYELDI